MNKLTTVDEASQKHDSMTRFETAAEEGEYENYLPLHAFVLTVETMDDAFQISLITGKNPSFPDTGYPDFEIKSFYRSLKEKASHYL